MSLPAYAYTEDDKVIHINPKQAKREITIESLLRDNNRQQAVIESLRKQMLEIQKDNQRLLQHAIRADHLAQSFGLRMEDMESSIIRYVRRANADQDAKFHKWAGEMFNLRKELNHLLNSLCGMGHELRAKGKQFFSKHQRGRFGTNTARLNKRH